MTAWEFLRKVEAGYCHSLPSRHVRGPSKRAATIMVEAGFLALLPARGRFPRRYVVTSSGSHHALDTFVMDGNLRYEISEMRSRSFPRKFGKWIPMWIR